MLHISLKGLMGASVTAFFLGGIGHADSSGTLPPGHAHTTVTHHKHHTPHTPSTPDLHYLLHLLKMRDTGQLAVAEFQKLLTDFAATHQVEIHYDATLPLGHINTARAPYVLGIPLPAGHIDTTATHHAPGIHHNTTPHPDHTAAAIIEPDSGGVPVEGQPGSHNVVGHSPSDYTSLMSNGGDNLQYFQHLVPMLETGHLSP